MHRTQYLGGHLLVLSKPYLVLLMPPPVTCMPANVWLVNSQIKITHNLQFHCCHLLFDVMRAAIEDPEQGLLVKTLDLCLYGLYIRHIVAVRQAKPTATNGRSRRSVVEYRIDLIRNGPTHVRSLQGEFRVQVLLRGGDIESQRLRV